MKMINKSTLVAEIKRLRDRAYELYGCSQFDTAYNNVLKSINALEVKEVDLELVSPCENCEGDGLAGTCASISELGRCPLKYRKQEPVSEELEKAAESWIYDDNNTRGADYIGVTVAEDAFKAGANWQKQKDVEVLLNHAKCIDESYKKGIKIGKAEMKQQMMKEAITGQLENGEDYLRIKCLYTSCRPQDDGMMIKLIIIKED